MAKPKIRFNGYTEDWEQRKLGDVFEQTSNLVNPKEDEIELWSLTVEDGLTKKSDRYNREFLVKKDDNFKEVRPGDIVYNPMNMTLGAVGYNGMAKSVAVSGYYTTMVAKENYDTYYINTWLKSPQAIRLYRTYATGSLIEKQRVQFPTLSIIPVAFPKYEEQTKIGNYFHFLDNLITLHQRKCEQTKTLKKYMLQKMFPQDGEKVPQIRFVGFTEDWEQRKFKELCDMVTVGIANSATHAYSDSGIVMFRNQNIKPNFLDDTDIIHINPEFEVKYKNKRLRKNDLLVARTGYPGTACVVPGKYENSQTFTTLIARPKKRVNSYFLCQYLNSDVGVKYFESTQIGGGQKNSGAGILNEMPVTLPPAAEEEKRIADFFTQLDHLITLHQRKCDELKEVKKFMLQNMFV